MQAGMFQSGQIHKRHEPLDVLRGIAALGILLINIRFMGAASTQALPAGAFRWLDTDWLIWMGAVIGLEGAMRGLFTLLFGAGIVLAIQKTGALDQVLGRAFGLLLLGAANAILLLWPGDVLFLYGLCVPALLLVRAWPMRRLLILTAALMAGAIALQGAHAQNLRSELALGLEAEISADSGQALTAAQWHSLAVREKALRKAGAASEAAQAEEEKARRGDYLQAATWSAAQWQRATLLPFLAGDGLETLAMMLLGMVLVRRWLACQEAMAGSSGLGAWKLALFGYALGLPAKAWVLAMAIQGDAGVIWLSALLEHAGRAGMSIGHAGMIMALIGAGRSNGQIRRALACVGRLALSNYLLASLLAGLWFWGLGQWGRADWAGLWLVALAIWAVQLRFSLAWEARFGLGPAERLLRAFSQVSHPPMPKGQALGQRLIGGEQRRANGA